MDLLIAFTDYYKTSRSITDPLIDFTDHYKTSSTRYKLLLTRYSLYRYTTLYNMADISKQINKGQKK